MAKRIIAGLLSDGRLQLWAVNACPAGEFRSSTQPFLNCAPRGISLQRPVNNADISTPRGTLKRWVRSHHACLDCGTSERPHRANGRCKRCDDRWRYRTK